MNKSSYWLTAGAAIVLLGLATFLWWQRHQTPGPTPSSMPASAAQTAVPDVAQAPASAASPPAIEHPIEAPAPEAAGTGPLDIEAGLTELFGRKAMLSMFQTQDFARRVVATVDNLGRSRAAAQLWPVNPTGGRLLVERKDDGETISSDNGLRYTPFVLLVETVDLRQAVALYTRFYPQFKENGRHALRRPSVPGRQHALTVGSADIAAVFHRGTAHPPRSR